MKVSRQLVVALINSDDSGLSEDDKRNLDQLASYIGTGSAVWSEETTFSKCNFSGLFDDCLELIDLVEGV
jgi:hypothetical protein